MLFEKKSDIDLEDLQQLQPAMWVLFTAALLYCKRNNITCRITSIISDRGNVNAKSTTHQTGRAIDLGIRTKDGWNDLHVSRLCWQLNKDFQELGAISMSDGKSRPAIAKSNHIHLQCRPKADISKFIKE